MALRQLTPLFRVQNVRFVSLQLGEPAEQMRAVPAAAGMLDLADRQTDWAETADLVAGLDLVISVDTAVAHLAGALDKPTWLLTR